LKIEISLDVVNKMLAYLGTRPYQEVFQIIQSVQKEAEEQMKGNQSVGGIGGDQVGGA
jgi:hypothetical protein